MQLSSVAPVPEVVVGSTFEGFADSVLTSTTREGTTRSATAILSRSLVHGARSTGLVVGRIQSGKTLSYESVMALARDNGFPLIILITGKSNALLAQGEQRVRRDLTAADEYGWSFLSPADKTQPLDHVRNEIQRLQENWDDPNAGALWRKTAVVTLLKHRGRIENLAQILEAGGFRNHPVLIIDDEADQASLNTMAGKQKRSPTYDTLLSLRDALPNHHYLQYTATPQAPLLIALDDELSPDFVHVLEPGSGYVGGDTYFELGSGLTTRMAPSAPNPNAETSEVFGPPATLRTAMIQFLVGATHTVASGKPAIRSMLVHPSRGQLDHRDFAHWIRRLAATWQEDLAHESPGQPSRLRDDFQQAWHEIQGTFPGLMPLNDCWRVLGITLRNLQVTELNTREGQTPIVDWDPTKNYILVGGDAIDRGFTVEGLTVTYMPRSVGMSILDSIQQRGRFFGYKAEYLGLCRVHLDADVHDAFEQYVRHESDMLRSLREIEDEQASLKSWRREFLLSGRMRATRASVIQLPMLRVTKRDRWIVDRSPDRGDAIPLDKANDHVDDVLGGASWSASAQGHQLTHVSMQTALRILTDTTPPSLLATPRFQALQIQLAILAEKSQGEGTVAIYRMRPHVSPVRRTVGANGEVRLFQGANANYSGDRETFDPNADLSVQIHEIYLHLADGSKGQSQLLTAWYVPGGSATDWFIQVGD